MQAGLVRERGGQASLAAVLSHVGLFDTVHTCMAIVEAWLWTVGLGEVCRKLVCK